MSLRLRISIILFLIAFMTAVISAMLLPSPINGEWISGALLNFSTEMAGALFTFILIDIVLSNERIKEERDALVQAALEGDQAVRRAKAKRRQEIMNQGGGRRGKHWG